MSESDQTNEEFVIDKDVPVPDKIKKYKYPLREMEIGDSFFIPARVPSQMSSYISVSKSATGFEYTSRSVIEDGIKGVRVWRV